MHSSIISALAALAGAITGGLTSVLASWLTQHAQARAQWLAQDKLQRQQLVDTYLEPNKTFLELRDMANSGSIDLLRDFSETCRAEFESLRAQF